MAQPASETTKAIRYPGFIPLLLGWILLGSLACIRHILLDKVPHTHFARELADWLTCYLPWALLTPLVFRLERGFPLNRTRWRRHAVLLLGAGLAISYLSAAMAVVIFMLEQRAFGVPVSAQGPWWRISSSEILSRLRSIAWRFWLPA